MCLCLSEEEPPLLLIPADGDDAGRGSCGGAVELLAEGIAGLLPGGGGAVDAILILINIMLLRRLLLFHRSSFRSSFLLSLSSLRRNLYYPAPFVNNLEANSGVIPVVLL